MTLSPVDNPHMAKARPDLPPYFLPEQDMKPGSSEPATENHHGFRRSLGPSFRDAYWVELDDGTVIANRFGLSAFSHLEITENRARIIWLGPEEGFGWLEKDEADEWELIGYLDPQPPKKPGQQLSVEDLLTEEDYEVMREEGLLPGLPHVHVAEGEDCPTCKRRVPHAKKKASPKTKVFSVRVPLDDADTFSEMLDAAAEHLGLKSQPHGRYFSLVAGLVLALQAPKNVMEKS